MYQQEVPLPVTVVFFLFNFVFQTEETCALRHLLKREGGKTPVPLAGWLILKEKEGVRR